MGCILIAPAAGRQGPGAGCHKGTLGTYLVPNFRISQPVLLVCALFPLGKHEVTGEVKG